MLVYAVGIGVVWRQVVSLDVETWYRTGAAGTTQITLAGWWYALVSLPSSNSSFIAGTCA